MKPFLTILFIFISWLLPLGIFIKSSREKIACNGQRAICLCRHQSDASTTKVKPSSMVLFQSGVAQNTSEMSSGISSHFFASQFIFSSPNLATNIFHEYHGLESLQERFPLEHVPKIA